MSSAAPLSWRDRIAATVPSAEPTSLPLPIVNPPRARPVRLATWNIKSGRRGLERVGAHVRSLQADIVALQEVDRCTRRSAGVDLLPAIARIAAFPHFHFFKAMDWKGGDYGLAFLSRWPLVCPRVGFLPCGRSEPRIVASALVETDEGPLQLHTTHLMNLDSSGRTRLAQARAILSRVSESDLPQVVVGDFNETPSGRSCREFARQMTDVFLERGEGPEETFPMFLRVLPARRIDYIFATRDIQPLRARVAQTDASDHHALVADLALPARDLRLAANGRPRWATHAA